MRSNRGRPNRILLHHNRPGMGNLQVEGTPGEKREAKPVPSYKGHGGLCGDSIHACKTRERPFRDIEDAVNTMSVCHLGIIAYELKRSLKWDAARQEFPEDAQANRLFDRARREPWVLWRLWGGGPLAAHDSRPQTIKEQHP